jgi:hypothetical protein
MSDRKIKIFIGPTKIADEFLAKVPNDAVAEEWPSMEDEIRDVIWDAFQNGIKSGQNIAYDRMKKQ